MSKPRGKPFEAGNKMGQGRPPGSRNEKRELLQQLLIEHGEEILLNAMRMATEGNRVALRLCMERLVPCFKQMEPVTGPVNLTIKYVDSFGNPAEAENKAVDIQKLDAA